MGAGDVAEGAQPGAVLHLSQALHRLLLHLLLRICPRDRGEQRHDLRSGECLPQLLDGLPSHAGVRVGAGDVDERGATPGAGELTQRFDRLALHVVIVVVPRDRDQRRQRARVARVAETFHGLAPRGGLLERLGQRDERGGGGRAAPRGGGGRARAPPPPPPRGGGAGRPRAPPRAAARGGGRRAARGGGAGRRRGGGAPGAWAGGGPGGGRRACRRQRGARRA